MNKKIKIMFGIILMIIFMDSRIMYCEVAKQSNIPVIMQPNSVIEFVSETEYKILEGGEYEGEGYETIDYGSDEDAYILTYPIPKAGSKVYYDYEGFVKKFENFGESSDKGDSNKPLLAPANKSSCSCNRAVIEEGQLNIKTTRWGKNNNLLTQTDKRTDAFGRFTTFRDVYGNHGNILEKGDVATCWHVDNPVHNTQLWCRSLGVCTWMRKADVGCLPDAILDVWYKGVQKFDSTVGTDPGLNYSFDGTSAYCYEY